MPGLPAMPIVDMVAVVDALQTLLAFRDHLGSPPEDPAAYAQTKRQLAAANDEDRPAYRAGKAPFISAVLARLEC